jgi:hypothetical protein|tara:strand:+ start:205 stop:603 length:399 start_codon:yes stop_codon:yes gene_type:complete
MWTYNGSEYNETPEDYQGFVYIITELDSGKKYLGKKNFWRPKVLPKNSKRSRRMRTRVESDWRGYYGSSKELQVLVEQRGGDNYKREIIRLCRTKGEMSYYEAKAQFDNDVLLSDEWFNNFIGCKIHARHIK